MSEQVTVSLAKRQDELWNRFHTQTNEMIVTKSGRKMFPKLEYSIKGLMPDKLYALMLHIEPVDESRYKFSSGEWVKSGKAEKHKEPKKVWHADGVMSGKQWMLNAVCFDRVKITNNSDASNASLIFLHSMHKYIPVLSIFESPSDSPIGIPQPSNRLVSCTKLSYTEFIAVTAYQNDAVIKLKIEFNPFAKGFREGSQSERKRSSPSRDDSASEEGCSQVSSPQPKKARTVSVSPPVVPHFTPAMFPPAPAINPMLFNPLFYQMVSGNLPQFSAFPFGFPCYSPVSFPTPPMTKIEKQEVDDNEDVEQEVNVV